MLRHHPPLDDRVPQTPFTLPIARACGISEHTLRIWTASGLLVHPIRNVFHRSELPDTLALRLDCLRLVVPTDAVVTDRTAGWLHGAPRILAPNDHLVVPKVSVFCPPGRRLRNGLVASGERSLTGTDIVTIDGIRVTTPLRTACDLGRLLHRDQAIAALDSFLRHGGFSRQRLLCELPRFRGYRGVVQLRELAPLADDRAQSPPESILRLRWLDLGFPTPIPQVEEAAPRGSYFIDVGNREHRVGAEYLGEEFHDLAHADHDEERLRWLRGPRRWTIIEVRRSNLFGDGADFGDRLAHAFGEGPS